MPEYGPHVHNVYDLPHDSELVYHGPKEQKTVTEPSREIPVLREADVVVVGGGPGGCPPLSPPPETARRPSWWSATATWGAWPPAAW